jgi:hypothetical protein
VMYPGLDCCILGRNSNIYQNQFFNVDTTLLHYHYHRCSARIRCRSLEAKNIAQGKRPIGMCWSGSDNYWRDATHSAGQVLVTRLCFSTDSTVIFG